MSEMLGKVADALAQSFRETVERTAGESFDRTGVTLPGKEVWERYARAAVLAMREPTDDVVRAMGSNYGPGFEEDYQMLIDTVLAP